MTGINPKTDFRHKKAEASAPALGCQGLGITSIWPRIR